MEINITIVLGYDSSVQWTVSYNMINIHRIFQWLKVELFSISIDGLLFDFCHIPIAIISFLSIPTFVDRICIYQFWFVDDLGFSMLVMCSIFQAFTCLCSNLFAFIFIFIFLLYFLFVLDLSRYLRFQLLTSSTLSYVILNFQLISIFQKLNLQIFIFVWLDCVDFALRYFHNLSNVHDIIITNVSLENPYLDVRLLCHLRIFLNIFIIWNWIVDYTYI